MSPGIRGDREASAWTHPSVKALGQGNMISVIQDRARSRVKEATAKGWSGPPFDPFELAELWGIPTVPRDDLRDARLIAEDGDLKIEYNPNRPIQRVRFSVAHELAHALFPDAASEPRHRLLSEERRGDEWQLELLCNVAAAELLMPADAFPDLAGAPLEIEHLLELRQRYEVSTEALILRVVDRSSEPATAVAAARLEGEAAPLFRLDYLAENNLPLGVRRGESIPSRVLARCTAVGYTNSGIEDWAGSPVHVQAVGIPAYPGDLFPRVAAIVRPAERAEGRLAAINKVRGDALKPAGEGVRIIAQLVNDATPSWGGRSFASQVARRWPGAQAEFRAWANARGLKLGTTHLTQVEESVWVASLVAQRGFGPASKPRVRYDALSAALHALGDKARELQASVHMPPIGTGLAGGDWDRIEQLVNSELGSRGIEVTVYRPPSAPVGEPESDAQLKLI